MKRIFVGLMLSLLSVAISGRSMAQVPPGDICYPNGCTIRPWTPSIWNRIGNAVADFANDQAWSELIGAGVSLVSIGLTAAGLGAATGPEDAVALGLTTFYIPGSSPYEQNVLDEQRARQWMAEYNAQSLDPEGTVYVDPNPTVVNVTAPMPPPIATEPSDLSSTDQLIYESTIPVEQLNYDISDVGTSPYDPTRNPGDDGL